MKMVAVSAARDKLKAGAIHFGLSACIALLAGLLVFELWYPYPYGEISGGRELFLLLMGVDVALGPLITVIIFNRLKSRRELVLDLSLVALVQLSALGYGLWTVFVARPVHLVFEYNRFAVVHALDVPASLLARTPPGITALPITGPTLLSLRPFKDGKEKVDMTMEALEGLSLSARPDLWQPYDGARSEILKEALPAMKLKARFKDQSEQIDSAARDAGRRVDELVYVPLIGRKSYWTVLLDPVSALPLAYLPLDSF